jgi:hypothetical protein
MIPANRIVSQKNKNSAFRQPQSLIKISKKMFLANPVVSPESQKAASHQPRSLTKIPKQLLLANRKN